MVLELGTSNHTGALPRMQSNPYTTSQTVWSLMFFLLLYTIIILEISSAHKACIFIWSKVQQILYKRLNIFTI